MKKHHWHVFRHEKLFEKQPLPHCQTPSKKNENKKTKTPEKRILHLK
jgi:hypothetical protein